MEELDPFSVASVLERINNRDDRPRYLDNALSPAIERCFTTDFSVFAQDGTVRVLPYTPRGAPLPQNRLLKRRANKIEIPGFGEGFTVNMEQRRDVAAIPTGTQIEASQSIVDRHLDQVDQNMGATEERQLAHAVRGFITDLEDEEILIDLYEELGAEQQVHEIDCTDAKVNWVRQMQPAYDMVDDGLTGDVTSSYLMLPGNGLGKWLQADPTYIQASTSETAVRLSLEDNRKDVHGVVGEDTETFKALALDRCREDGVDVPDADAAEAYCIGRFVADRAVFSHRVAGRRRRAAA